MANEKLRSRNVRPDLWKFIPVTAPVRRGRRTTSGPPNDVLGLIDQSRLIIDESFDIVPAKPTRRAVVAPREVAVEVNVKPGEAVVLMSRHPSGAITFHVPTEAPARLRGARNTRLFTLPASSRTGIQVSGVRRGPVGAVVRAFVLRAVAPLATRVLATLARSWETRAWASRGLNEGWFRVIGTDDASFRLESVAHTSAELLEGPCLLMVHGTFSDTAGSFRSLARSGFFAQARKRYGNRIFAFEHFTVSRSPEENLKALLSALPRGKNTFDVVAYSRGGLLCRLLTEKANTFGAPGTRFELGKAVFIEAALRGTPLAQADRYDQLLSWVANLLELFPTNPLTTAAAWLTDAIIWLAHRLSGALPGIAAMDPSGPLVRTLLTQGNADARYSAVGAEFSPDDGLRARMLEVIANGFFDMSNDLVVPTLGCYTLGAGNAGVVAESQRLVFDATQAGDQGPGKVHHLNAVGQSKTAKFLQQALLEAQSPARGDVRNVHVALTADRAPQDIETPVPPLQQAISTRIPEVVADTQFLIIVLSNEGDPTKPSRILATWGGAKVQEHFSWSDSDTPGAGQRWKRIIDMHNRLEAYFGGDPGAELPDENALQEFGEQLFVALMGGQVGRLYDEARAKTGASHLTVTLTAESGRVAEKPWEFAFDPARRTWLATEEVHFVRDVLGAVPADQLSEHPAPLRVLVAYAQPVDAQTLSVDDEEKVIRRAFQPLVDLGLAVVDVLPRATPATLQQKLEPHSRYDVLHFVGHGEFDSKTQQGMLLFEDERHNSQLLSAKKFREIVENRRLRLIFLNACESGRGGYADFTRGTAPALLATGIPAVVANQFSVFDSAAVTFAQNLYARLGIGRSLVEAMRESRIALKYSLEGTNIDWAVPVLFTRVPDLRLCTSVDVLSAPTLASALPRDGVITRGVSPPRRYRVGVWDMSRRFPNLEDVIARLNGAQGEIEFLTVDVSVPLAASVMADKRVSEGGQRYLNAEVARSRLRRLPLELQLDTLVGFTRESMISGGTRDVFAAWGEDSDGAPNSVELISVAGFDLPASGQMTDAFIMNNLVGAIAGVVGDLGSHDDGERRCPLYYNDDLDLNLLVGRQRFDHRVRRDLRKLSPELLAALEAILIAVPATVAAGDRRGKR